MEDFKISSFVSLDKIDKQICKTCGKKRMYFCYDCRVYMPSTSKLVPQVQLPFKIDIVKHRKEKNGKSTALHCLLLAPSSTRVFDAPDILDYDSVHDENIVLVYPSPEAKSVAEFVQENGPINRLVFLDATWFQVGGLRMLQQLQNLPHVKLKSYKTLYWRPQKGYSDEHLATIEAIYYAVREAFQATSPEAYDGRFDDLLFWFFYFRLMVDKGILQNNLTGRTTSQEDNSYFKQEKGQ